MKLKIITTSIRNLLSSLWFDWRITAKGCKDDNHNNTDINNSQQNAKEEAIVSMKDTGTGIEPRIYPKLFDKFTTKSHQGTEILFVVQCIIVYRDHIFEICYKEVTLLAPQRIVKNEKIEIS